jgi:hypothetical protein
VKDHEVSNMLAVLADAEQRSTATLVELVAATALFKLAPPEGDEVVMVEISQGDMAEAAKEFFWRTEYDENGTMRLYLTRKLERLESGQFAVPAEVTSES